MTILESMAHISLTSEKLAVKKSNMAYGDITGMILMTGAQVKGSVSLTFDTSLALEILSRLFHEQAGIGWSDQDVTDMVAEITNIITGQAEKLLRKKGYTFDMALPVVVSGKRHTIAHSAAGPTILMPFFSAWGHVYVEVCFDKRDRQNRE